jgi:hypothetical protein
MKLAVASSYVLPDFRNILKKSQKVNVNEK